MTTNFTCFHLLLEILTKLNTKTSREVIYPLQKLTPQAPQATNLKISFIYLLLIVVKYNEEMG